MAILAAVLGATVHIYSLGSLAAGVAESRSIALMVAETQLETMQAEGYAALPAIGEYPLHVPMLGKLPGAAGTLTVAQGPDPQSRTVSVKIAWQQRPGRPTSAVTLSRIIAAGGMSR